MGASAAAAAAVHDGRAETLETSFLRLWIINLEEYEISNNKLMEASFGIDIRDFGGEHRYLHLVIFTDISIKQDDKQGLGSKHRSGMAKILCQQLHLSVSQKLSTPPEPELLSSPAKIFFLFFSTRVASFLAHPSLSWCVILYTPVSFFPWPMNNVGFVYFGAHGSDGRFFKRRLDEKNSRIWGIAEQWLLMKALCNDKSCPKRAHRDRSLSPDTPPSSNLHRLRRYLRTREALGPSLRALLGRLPRLLLAWSIVGIRRGRVRERVIYINTSMAQDHRVTRAIPGSGPSIIYRFPIDDPIFISFPPIIIIIITTSNFYVFLLFVDPVRLLWVQLCNCRVILVPSRSQRLYLYHATPPVEQHRMFNKYTTVHPGRCPSRRIAPPVASSLAEVLPSALTLSDRSKSRKHPPRSARAESIGRSRVDHHQGWSIGGCENHPVPHMTVLVIDPAKGDHRFDTLNTSFLEAINGLASKARPLLSAAFLPIVEPESLFYSCLRCDGVLLVAINADVFNFMVTICGDKSPRWGAEWVLRNNYRRILMADLLFWQVSTLSNPSLASLILHLIKESVLNYTSRYNSWWDDFKEIDRTDQPSPPPLKTDG
ncbi:hypothetical protein GEV33_010302 [Tenebrio molitor]|uniref:Uncharacterized protein n=1 Tax=Tenebrio molitor TaxID=7067 RepID=A0A8J6HD62_TENMO|nr:hypothetical protein GEV33_010302 [Tenebrio molitor]